MLSRVVPDSVNRGKVGPIEAPKPPGFGGVELQRRDFVNPSIPGMGRAAQSWGRTTSSILNTIQ